MSEEKKDTLQDELENLAETFQSEYDKTVAEEENEEAAPVVPEQAEPAAELPATEEKDVKKVPRKKNILSNLVSFVLLIALLLVTAGVTFYASAFTDIDSYIYSMKCADSTESVADKLGYLNEALAYLKDETQGKEKIPFYYRSLMQKANEQITVCTVTQEDYAAAMSYMHKNMTEEEIASPKTAEFKAFLKIAGVFETIATECVDKIAASLGDGSTEPDYAALAAGYTEDETLAADIEKILSNVGSALTAENNGDTTSAAQAYKLAIDGLNEYSTFSRILTEKYAVCLVQTEGYAAALTYVNSVMDAEDETEPLTKEFSDFAGIADIFETLADTIYDDAKALVGTSATAPESYGEQVAALNAPAYVEKEITALYADVANGFAKINAGSYASAKEHFMTAADSFEGYGITSAALDESVVIASAYADGYSQALTAAQALTSAEGYEVATEDFAAFLAVEEIFETLDETQFAAVSEAVAGITDAQGSVIDLSAQVEALDLPAFAKADATALLTNIARGIISENAGDNETALDYYKTAGDSFAAAGVTANLVLEKQATLLNKTQNLHAAYSFVNANADKLAADADAALTEDFAALLNTLQNAFTPALVEAFIVNAQQAVIEADYADVAIADIVEKSGIDSSVADFYEAYYTPLAAALKAEKDKNLTLAVANYTALAELLSEDNVELPESLLKGLVTAAFNSGDLPNAVNYCSLVKNADELQDEQFKALYETVMQCDAAMQSAYEVFYEAYYASYYGTVPSREELTAQFETLLTEDSDKYERAFNLYYRYISEMYFFSSEADSAEYRHTLIEQVRELIPEMLFIYGYDVLNESLNNKNYAEAKAIAEEMLAINAYDDAALAALAQISRTEGDLAKATEYASKGISTANEQYASELEYIVLSLLNDTPAAAYDSVVAIYDKGLSSMQECETIAVYAALFTDATAEQQNKLSEIVTYIENDIYGSYGYTYTENTTALIEGTKTPEEIFLNGSYGLFPED